MIKAVVNVNVGCYEEVIEPSFENSTWDFYTITDLPLREHRKCSNEYFFEPLIIDDPALEGYSDKRKASYYKAKALSLLEQETGIDYDLVVVLDSNIEITGNLDDFVDEQHSNYDISMTPHPECQNYIHEAQIIEQIAGYKGDTRIIETSENIQETMDEMARLGFKFNNGYHESNVSIRSNTKRTKAFERAWAKNYLKFATKRDQPSLAFTRWEKKSVQFNTLKESVVGNKTMPLKWHPHRHNLRT